MAFLRSWLNHRGVFVVRIFGILCVGLFCTHNLALAQSCGDLTKQLSEMQKAQALLLQSLVKKNDSLANVLDRYAGDFEASDLKLSKTDIESLHGSASAFRNHRQREQALIEKFTKQSQDLILKTNACLASSDRLGGIATQ